MTVKVRYEEWSGAIIETGLEAGFFKIGMTIEGRIDSRGRLVPFTPRMRLRRWLWSALFPITPAVVTAIDEERGTNGKRQICDTCARSRANAYNARKRAQRVA